MCASVPSSVDETRKPRTLSHLTKACERFTEPRGHRARRRAEGAGGGMPNKGTPGSSEAQKRHLGASARG
eukprot:4663142-Prymnesium_polylepis.1